MRALGGIVGFSLLVLPLTLTSCGGTDCGPPLPVSDSELQSNERCVPLQEKPTHSEPRLRLDGEAGTVTIEYEIVDGGGTRKVEERWRIVKRDGVPRD